jgi:peptide/nickel transport system permease protein
MGWFILGRIVQGVVVMLVVALVSFSVFQYVGDPVTSIFG